MAKKLYFDNTALKARFEADKSSFIGADLAWLNNVRTEAMAQFMALGIPGPKVEEWKYTNLTFLANENFTALAKSDQKKEAKIYFDKAYIKAIRGPVVVFVNGYLDRTLSTFEGLDEEYFSFFSEQPQNFKNMLENTLGSTSFNHLNCALVTDGYRLNIPENTVLDDIIQIIHIATSAAHMKSFYTRTAIEAGKNAQGQIMESFIGPDHVRYWNHMISDLTLAEGAEMSYVQYQEQGLQAIHMTELHTVVSDEANLKYLTFQLGAELSRTELINNFVGEKADIELWGAYLAHSKQSHDIFTRINHNKPNCDSNQLFRGVLNGGGKSAFQGKVVVGRDAQKTNAHQSNKNLLLDRKAEANAKPELLIYADDVKCSHGATIGELDIDQLFYLRARGLDEASAKGLLVEAFISEVFEGWNNDTLRQKFSDKAANWLKKR